MPTPIILFARQRSGTNYFRALMEQSTDDIYFTEGEIFSHNKVDKRPDNFWNYLSKNDNHYIPTGSFMAKIWEEYNEYMSKLTNKKYYLLDIKYTSTHHLNPTFYSWMEPPFLLKLIARKKINVIHIVRENVFHTYISALRAKKTGKTLYLNKDKVEDVKITVDLSELEREIKLRREEIKFARQYLTALDINHIEILYENLNHYGLNDKLKRNLINLLGIKIGGLNYKKTKKIINDPFDLIVNKVEVMDIVKRYNYYYDKNSLK